VAGSCRAAADENRYFSGNRFVSRPTYRPAISYAARLPFAIPLPFPSLSADNVIRAARACYKRRSLVTAPRARRNYFTTAGYLNAVLVHFAARSKTIAR